MNPTRLGRQYMLGLAAISFGSTWLTLASGWVSLPQIDFWWPDTRVASDAIQYGLREPGYELILVFIGSPNCVWSNVETLAPTIKELKQVLAETAKARDRSFGTVGIAVSNRSDDGLRYLRRFGRFDEVMSGRSWLNTGLLKYVHMDFHGPARTPQVILLERVTKPSIDPAVGDERLLLRKVGLNAISGWLRTGAPLPAGDVTPAGGRTIEST